MLQAEETAKKTLPLGIALVAAALSSACSSSSGGNGDGGVTDAGLGPSFDAADANEEEAESSPVFGCSEAQLAYGTSMACGQCVAQNCAALLKACTNCVLCQMQLNQCPACLSMCFSM